MSRFMKEHFLRICLMMLMALAIAVNWKINVQAEEIDYDIPAEAVIYKDHSYMRYDESMTWQEADEYCRSLGGHLVSIDSDEGEQNFVRDLISQGSKNAYWNSLVRVDSGILFKKHKWEWQYRETATTLFEEPLAKIYDSDGKGRELTFWSKGEPNNEGTGGAEENRCVMLARDEGTGKAGDWIDLNENGNPEGYFSKDNLGFVCEWDKSVLIVYLDPATFEFEQSEYYLSPGETAECQVEYEDLPEVTLDAEYDDSIIEITEAQGGVVTIKALSVGTTTLKIIAHAKNEDITAECTIIVEDSNQVHKGVDISSHNGNVNFEQLKESGCEFVII